MKKILSLISILSFGLIICFLVSGCSLIPENATPVEKNMIFSQQASQTYLTLYNTYQQLDKVLVGKDKTVLHRDVAPIMNKAKKALIRYNKLIIDWKRSGYSNLDAITKSKKMFMDFAAEAQQMFLTFTGKGVE